MMCDARAEAWPGVPMNGAALMSIRPRSCRRSRYDLSPKFCTMSNVLNLRHRRADGEVRDSVGNAFLKVELEFRTEWRGAK